MSDWSETTLLVSPRGGFNIEIRVYLYFSSSILQGSCLNFSAGFRHYEIIIVTVSFVP